MFKNILFATLEVAKLFATLAVAKESDMFAPKIVYPGDQVDQIVADPQDYPFVFKWPTYEFRCGGTMITPSIALTAAHCIEERWNSGSRPGLMVELQDGDGGSDRYTVEEIRTNDCWDFSAGGPYSADIALMFLAKEIPNAKQGFNYITPWNAETMGDVEGETFWLAGWGQSGAVNENGNSDESHHQSEIFHRGQNVINEIRDNMLVYTMDSETDGGLWNEVMGHYGDSGSGALLEKDGEFHIIGVKSNGGMGQYGTSHEYTRVGGYHWKWIQDNINSDTRVLAEGCESNVRLPPNRPGCIDTNVTDDGTILADQDNDACSAYVTHEEWCGLYDDEDFDSMAMCCACGGGVVPEDQGDDENEGEGQGDEGEGQGDEGEGQGDEGEGQGDDGENQDPQNCSCDCGSHDMTCWEGCYTCLDAIFGDEEEEEEAEDVGEEVEEEGEAEDEGEEVDVIEVPEPEPILGIDCSQCIECTFPEMECWQACFECLFPYCEHDDWECIGMAMEES